MKSTSRRTAELLDRDDIGIVSNPEFLREGTAVFDFLNPDRIVVGSAKQDAAERVAALYARLGAPTVLTDAASAEMIKYAANCFLAMKLSYVNAIAGTPGVNGRGRRHGARWLGGWAGVGAAGNGKAERRLVEALVRVERAAEIMW